MLEKDDLATQQKEGKNEMREFDLGIQLGGQ